MYYTLRHKLIAVRRVGAPWPGWLWQWNKPVPFSSTGHKFLPPLLISGRTCGRMPAWRRYRGPHCPNCRMSPQLMECRTSPTPGIWDHLSGGALDPLGHHAVTCRHGGNVVIRHNRLRDEVFNLCRRAHLSVSVERDLAHTRHAGILIAGWTRGKPMCGARPDHHFTTQLCHLERIVSPGWCGSPCS